MKDTDLKTSCNPKDFAEQYRKTGKVPRTCAKLDEDEMREALSPGWVSELSDENRRMVRQAIHDEYLRQVEAANARAKNPVQKAPFRAAAARAVWDDCTLARQEARPSAPPSPAPQPIAEPRPPKPPKLPKPRKEKAPKASKAAEPVPAVMPDIPLENAKPVETATLPESVLNVGPGRNRGGAEIVGRFTVVGKAFACHLKRVRVNQYSSEIRPKVFCFTEDTPAPRKKKAAKTAT